MTRRHVLVVGGTGMLAGCCQLLAKRGDKVTILGRRQASIERTLERCQSVLCAGFAFDYRDEYPTNDLLRLIVEERGSIDQTVCWIDRDQAPFAHILFGRHTRDALYHVLPSHFANPSSPERLSILKSEFAANVPDISYRTMILGFMPRNAFGSRWLSHEEISGGIFEAVDLERAHSVVGHVRPWSSRP